MIMWTLGYIYMEQFYMGIRESFNFRKFFYKINLGRIIDIYIYLEFKKRILKKIIERRNFILIIFIINFHIK